ncbi:MAG: NAD(P)/FAD-dependent oxidoreductase, partial [Clostridiales bacterium]|nr:NAD(P)/FAD-dependent oxidoreductase [Candidatus Apopatousia equi]
MKKTDVIVIGAGMAGVTAAIYLSRANANFILIEKDSVGGKLKELHKIENFPTIEETTGKEIIDGLLQQLEYQHINVEKGNVQTILKDVEGF